MLCVLVLSGEESRICPTEKYHKCEGFSKKYKLKYKLSIRKLTKNPFFLMKNY